jgi:Cys-rich repeat protein
VPKLGDRTKRVQVLLVGGSPANRRRHMKIDRKSLLVFGFFSLVVGCSSASDDSAGQTRSDRVVLDVRCTADSECPSGFECELEHGTSYCKSHGGDGGSGASGATATCPPGFEQEVEHGGTFCKPHGGNDDHGDGGSASGSACASNADCAPGLECEVELEHGVTTSFCKPHGGGSNSGKGSDEN